ncbi:MAG: hypothetical protein IIU00_00810, partial [Clostridia bacterium]|nr:hypothetical protein [Clostridia bacterium]
EQRTKKTRDNRSRARAYACGFDIPAGGLPRYERVAGHGRSDVPAVLRAARLESAGFLYLHTSATLLFYHNDNKMSSDFRHFFKIFFDLFQIADVVVPQNR